MRARSLLAVTAAVLAAAPAASLAADGENDPTFGTNGRVLTPVGSLGTVQDVEPGPGGSIVATGEGGDGNKIVRWLADGTVDQSFGSGGVVTLPDPPGSTRAATRSLAGGEDGVLYVGASYTDAAFLNRGALYRLTASGALDPTFDGDGIRDEGRSSAAPSVVRDAAGRPVSISRGSGSNGERSWFDVRRYLLTGARDGAFDDDGIAAFAETAHSDGRALANRAGGGLLAAGYVAVAPSAEAGQQRHGFGVTRIGSDGKTDPSFGNGGLVVSGLAGRDMIGNDVAETPDGGAVVVGFDRPDPRPQGGTGAGWVIAKYDCAGQLDPKFGDGGLLRPDFGEGEDMAETVAVDAKGRILVGGMTFGKIFTIVRYLPDGSHDRSFAYGFGVYSVDLSGPAGVPNRNFTVASNARDLYIRPDGRIVAAAIASNGSRSVFAAVRLTGDTGPSTTAATCPRDDDGTPPVGNGGSGSGSSGSGSGSGAGGSSSGGGVSGSAPSTGGIPVRIVGRMRGLKLTMLGKRPSRGALRFRVGWARGSKGRGEIKVHATRRGKKVLVASLRFTISGGTGATLRVPLTITGRRIFGAVRKNGRTPVRATLTATPAP